MHLYRLGVAVPVERIAIYGGKIPRTPDNLHYHEYIAFQK